MRARADASLFYFAKAVLGYKDLAQMHLEFCDRIQDDEAYQNCGYLLPRGHFKSTLATKAMSLWVLTKDPNERILIIGESDKVAAKNLVDIRWHIENNEILAWLYPELIPPDFNATKWTDTEILLPRPGSFDEPSITCDGIGAKRTGFHYTRILFDDPFGEKASKSQAEAESVWSWMQYAPGLLHDPARSKQRWTGTRWKHHTGDCYGRLMKEDSSVRWYVRGAIENGQPIFPERFTLETLELIKQREGIYKYSCQYMNNPTIPEGADFPESWIKEYTISDDRKTLIPMDGTPPVRLADLTRITVYDPSSGGKTAECENAVGTTGMSADRRIFDLKDWGKNCGYDEALEELMCQNDQFVVHEQYYESVGSQKEVETQIMLRQKMTECHRCGKGAKDTTPHRRVRLKPVKPPGGRMSKDDRIRDFAQVPFEQGRVYLRRGMDELRTQIVSFPHHPLKDRFDRLAYAIHLLRPPISAEEAKTQEQEVERRRALAQPRTNATRNYGGYI